MPALPKRSGPTFSDSPQHASPHEQGASLDARCQVAGDPAPRRHATARCARQFRHDVLIGPDKGSRVEYMNKAPAAARSKETAIHPPSRARCVRARDEQTFEAVAFQVRDGR
jgi:hypothetical protein